MSRLSDCPVCQKPATQEHKPFCSHRCKDVDLTRWFNGNYSVRVIADEYTDEGQIKNDED